MIRIPQRWIDFLERLAAKVNPPLEKRDRDVAGVYPIRKRPIEIEIVRVRKALLRYEERLAIMRARAKGACCPSCFHGSKYTELADKYERTEAWLTRLEAKAKRHRVLA